MPDTTPTTDRVRSAAQRALQSLDDLIADTTDPGVEALGARHELATALFNTSPAPARLVLGTTDQQPCTSRSSEGHRCGTPHGPQEAHSAMEGAALVTWYDQPPKTADDLRDRIAAAMREHYLCTNRDEADADGNSPCRCGDWREPGSAEDDENDWDSHLAGAVLAVLPAPVDRAAVLREAADALDGRAAVLRELSSSDYSDESFAARELTEAADRFRRLADEAQQPECTSPPCLRPDDCRNGCRTAADELSREAQQPDTIGLCADCGVPRETHHHGYVRTPHADDEAQQPETEACTCAAAGAAFAPAGHYADCPAADQPDTETEATKGDLGPADGRQKTRLLAQLRAGLTPIPEQPAAKADDRCPWFCIPCMTDESHHPAP